MFYSCQEEPSDLLAMKHNLYSRIKWYYDNQVNHEDVPADTRMGTPIEARWISKEHGWIYSDRDFRSIVQPNKYVTWSSESDLLEFKAESQSNLNERYVFQVCADIVDLLH